LERVFFVWVPPLKFLSFIISFIFQTIEMSYFSSISLFLIYLFDKSIKTNIVVRLKYLLLFLISDDMGFFSFNM
jgi:hypothetical protein